ncbi:PLP-dependent aminotransferase family protein [Cupriavidus taiwanensis]|uniref:Amino transferase n=1 Tax=Cupriavidus taiwanensis (strain DSM 17343 / BCRC 17206 / CCUG 44338 / CIP 107171 / LMG 19424 / R1) TaxID=977880 RepID=B3RBG5_CUPTR|nr:PLP-dependent aminotransferase family protein [Cupriavidus taiwanensis]CAQ72240.1 putative amino transferase [Cupriavidus taiwanensis LMG 19424]
MDTKQITNVAAGILPNAHLHPSAKFPNAEGFASRVGRVQSSAVRDLLKYSKMPGVISLAGGIPASDLFDAAGLRESLAAVVDSDATSAFQYGLTEGEPALREQIMHLLRHRGIAASPAGILVTSGSQQGLDLAARTLLNPGDTVLVERPSYLAALQAFGLAEANIVSVPSDEAGIDVDWIESYASRHPVKAIYVVPNFGNPSGRTLSLERRQQLTHFAGSNGTYIIEDDPYGELRLCGDPVASIVALAAESAAQCRVLYLSSFSKILSPGLRAGWMVLPPSVFDRAALVKQAIDLHTCSLSQQLVAAYLANGRLQPRFELLRNAYRERRDALISGLHRHLGEAIHFNVPEGGMFLWARFAPQVDTARVLQAAIQAGVVFVPGAAFFADTPERNTLRLSYSTVDAESADIGASRLAQALRASCNGALPPAIPADGMRKVKN